MNKSIKPTSTGPFQALASLSLGGPLVCSLHIMFHLAATGLWQIAELHTLAKDTCMANLLTDQGQGRAGFLRTGVHCGGEKGQQGILSNRMLNHENSTFSMDLMSTRNRLMPSTEDLGPQKVKNYPSHFLCGSYSRAPTEQNFQWLPSLFVFIIQRW